MAVNGKKNGKSVKGVPTLVAWPRLQISAKTYARIRKIVERKGISQKEIGDKIATAGIKALGL